MPEVFALPRARTRAPGSGTVWARMPNPRNIALAISDKVRPIEGKTILTCGSVSRSVRPSVVIITGRPLRGSNRAGRKGAGGGSQSLSLR